MTHLTRPLDRRLCFFVITLPRDQTRRNPFSQKKRLKIAIRESVRKVTDNTKRKLVQRLATVIVREHLLNKLEDRRRMRDQQLDYKRMSVLH